MLVESYSSLLESFKILKFETVSLFAVSILVPLSPLLSIVTRGCTE